MFEIKENTVHYCCFHNSHFQIMSSSILTSSLRSMTKSCCQNYRTPVRSFWSRKRPPPPAVSASISGETFSIVVPQLVSPQISHQDIPTNVTPPVYYKSGIPSPSPRNPEVKTEKAVNHMRASCKLARQILNQSLKIVRPGVTTQQIDDLVTQLAFDNNAYPSPLNYRKFPKSVCTSVNNVVCHGIPDDRPLVAGDMINVDVTVYLDGYHGDCSETVLVLEDGEVGDKYEAAKRLLEVARQALYVGIDVCGPGKPFASIGELC